MDGICRAFRVKDGSEAWRFAAGGAGIRGDVVADRNFAYFATIGPWAADGPLPSQVIAVDIRSGGQVWRTPATGAVDDLFVLPQTIVAISVVHITVGSGVRYEVRLLEFDKASGAPRRTVGYGTAIPIAMRKNQDELVVTRLHGTAIELVNFGTLTSTIVANAPAPIGAAALTKGRLFVASAAKGSTSGGLQAIAVDTWNQIWSRQTLAECTIFADETNVVLAQSQADDTPVDFRCLDARTGSERWSVLEGNRHPSSAAGLFSEGRFITQPRSRDTTPYKTLTVVFEASSGREIGRFDSPFSTSWVVEADKFVLSCHWEHIFAFDLVRSWTIELGSAVRGRPAFGDGHIFVGSAGGQVNKIRIQDGSSQWQKALPGPVESSIAVDETRVYVGHAQGVSALDVASGATAWTFGTPAAVTSVVRRSGGDVLFGCRDNNLHAVDCRDGKELWSFLTGGFVEGGLAIESDELYFGSFDGRLYALDSSGALKWKFETVSEIKSTPLVVGDMVLFGNADGDLTALARVDGSVRWRVRLPGSLATSSPVLYQNEIIVADENGHVHRVKLTGGAPRWTIQHLGRLRGDIQLRGATAYLGSLDGELLVIDVSSGTLTRTIRAGGPLFAGPVLAGEQVIVADETGRVQAILP